MPQLIATGTARASATPFTLASGESATISLFAAAGVSYSSDTVAYVEKVASNGVVTAVQEPGGVLIPGRTKTTINGPGSWQVTKFPSAVSFGVDRD